MASKEKNESALKHLFGEKLLLRMARSLKRVYPEFDSNQFVKLYKLLAPLEMKPRVRCIRDELYRQLPKSYPKAVSILLRSAKGKELKSFDYWPYAEYVQTYGTGSLDISLSALKEITCLFTSEFAVRPFLKAYPKQTLSFLLKCAKDPNVHIRRWATEGTRPRLPWGERLDGFIEDPTATRPILEILKSDRELYVRRSVANHLNDIAKDHPLYVIKLLTQWRRDARVEEKVNIEWIIQKALRSLIKGGHPKALSLIGVNSKPKLRMKDFTISNSKFEINDKIDFSFSIASLSATPQKLVVDYIVHYAKANGRTSPKVFKLKTWVLSGNTSATIIKSHHLREVTTRKFYFGAHSLEIQINGVVMKRWDWSLISSINPSRSSGRKGRTLSRKVN